MLHKLWEKLKRDSMIGFYYNTCMQNTKKRTLSSSMYCLFCFIFCLDLLYMQRLFTIWINQILFCLCSKVYTQTQMLHSFNCGQYQSMLWFIILVYYAFHEKYQTIFYYVSYITVIH